MTDLSVYYASMYAHLQNAVRAVLMVLLVALVFSPGFMHIWIAGNVHVAAANNAIYVMTVSNQSVNQSID